MMYAILGLFAHFAAFQTFFYQFLIVIPMIGTNLYFKCAQVLNPVGRHLWD